MAKLTGYRIKIMDIDVDGKKVVLNRVSFFTATEVSSPTEGGTVPTEYKVEVPNLLHVFKKRPEDYPSLPAYCQSLLNRDAMLEAVPDGSKMKLVRVTFLDDLMKSYKAERKE